MKFPNFQIKNVEASSTLLFVAVIIEILVASLGVFLGIVMVTEGSSQVEVPLLNRFVPAMMFFVVAVVELTRVPLIISIYRSHSFIWKFVGSGFLLLIMFIAFETMLVGFKRNVMLMEGDLNSFRIDQNNIQNQLNDLSLQIEDNSKLTLEQINENFNQTITKLNEERENRLSPHYKTLDDIATKTSGNQDKALNNKISSLEEQISQNNSLRQNEITNIENRISKQIDSLNEQINILNNRKNQINAQITALPQGLFGVNKDKFNALNGELEQTNNEIKQINREKNNLNTELSSQINSINSKYDKRLSDLQGELNEANQKAIDNENVNKNSFQGQTSTANKAIEDITNDIAQREEDAKKFKENQLARLEEKTSINDKLTDEKIELQKELIEINNNINKQTQGNLIYQFAENFGFVPACKGVSQPSDVSSECKGLVESLWFGSLSAVVAVTGTAVALGSEVLRTSTARKRNNPYGKRSARYLLVGIYRYFRKPKIKTVTEEKVIEKPVEVIKEVPVQKIEYVEVPKIQDVVKKEIVHVPLFTNDESLIDISKNRKNKVSDDESN